MTYDWCLWEQNRNWINGMIIQRNVIDTILGSQNDIIYGAHPNFKTNIYP